MPQEGQRQGEQPRLVVGISGASGVVYGLRALDACRELGIAFTDIVSGAYHDAMVLGAAVSMGMVFVPSRDGISHSPHEYTTPEDLERGITVLAATLRNLARGS